MRGWELLWLCVQFGEKVSVSVGEEFFYCAKSGSSEIYGFAL